MITDSYDIETEPMINLFDFYGRRGDFADICLIIFSKEIHRHLLDSYESEIIATMPACNGDTHIYKTTYKGVTITFYLSGIGSAVASSQCHLASWLTGASKFIMFGSCGSLDRTTTQGRFIIPTQSYRGDGCSYYFAAPSDYIDIAASKELSIIFDKLSVPYITGKIWTTDSMIRETKGLVRKRMEEGCIAVEMELAGVQSVCDFYNLKLYAFFETGDILDTNGYEAKGLNNANHSLNKLYIALERQPTSEVYQNCKFPFSGLYKKYSITIYTWFTECLLYNN